MELIATHLGADFDAFASMLAARRLYPGAELFFPGSREEALRRFLETGLVDFREIKQRQVDPGAIERVVLCDIRQRRRIGVLGEWLAERPEVPVLAYDHHPPSEDDLPLAGGRVDTEVGATATLMVEELSERGLEPTAVEATVLLLGLYEDTGSLTYAATSPRDHRAAAWLLERGGDLAAVRRWATFHLDSQHLDVLHRMLRRLEVVRLRGHRVGIVTLELGEFVDELAPLVSRAVELADLPLLFALFGDGEAVQVIARGDVAGVDLGEVLDGLGGGGHRTAAAARLHGRTALEVREMLLDRLAAVLPPAARAADLAIGDFVVVAAGTTVARAKEQLVERRVNSAPVAAAGEEPTTSARLAGAVTRQMLDAALQHGMGERPVERVMEADLEWVAPNAPAEEVGRRMLERHPRFVLVGDGATGRAQGLISRMQVLRHLHGRLAAEEVSLDRAEHLRTQTEPAAKLLDRLGEPLARRVEVAARLSREHGIPVYLVGGLVRDLLLERENRDLDLVVEGDGPCFAHLLAGELGGRVREHRAFLTAVVVDAEGFHTDVATARSEFYRQPAALPEVTTGALRQDLYRRDFTINTLAIRLGPGRAPELIDSFGGRRDLADGVIRVLHSLSFLDDPTRVLRAVRLEQRLGFSIAPETLHLVRVALEEGAFDRLSGSRLREELIQLLGDPAVALAGLERLAELGLLPVLHPRLALDDLVRRRLVDALGAFQWLRLEGLDEPEVELWRLLLVALTLDLDPDRVERLAERLMLAGRHRAVVAGAAERLARARRTLAQPDLPPHAVSDALADLPGEDLLLLLAGGPEPVRERVRRDLTEWRRLELKVRGADLVAAGVPPGPAIGEALRATRAARLDGAIRAEEEARFALDAARAAEAAAGEQAGGERSLAGMVAVFSLLLSLFASFTATAQPIPGGRGDVLLRRDCRSSIAREEVTLFGNGTVRLRSGPLGEERMVLGEVSRDEVESLVAAIRREDLREAGAGAAGPEGDWVERCVLELPVIGAAATGEVESAGRGDGGDGAHRAPAGAAADGSLGPGRPAGVEAPTRFHYGHLDSLALPLARVVALVDDLGARVAAGAAAGGLPAGYRPRAGDVLRRIDGVLFRVVRATADLEGMPRGWELQGVVQPLAVYVIESDLGREFVELVSREDADAP